MHLPKQRPHDRAAGIVRNYKLPRLLVIEWISASARSIGCWRKVFCRKQVSQLCSASNQTGASMLHLRELQALRWILLLRETGRLWENWLITKTAFPSPPWCDVSCWCPVGDIIDNWWDHFGWCHVSTICSMRSKMWPTINRLIINVPGVDGI